MSKRVVSKCGYKIFSVTIIILVKLGSRREALKKHNDRHTNLYLSRLSHLPLWQLIWPALWNLVLHKLIIIELPPQKDHEADVSSFSPSSERTNQPCSNSAWFIATWTYRFCFLVVFQRHGVRRFDFKLEGSIADKPLALWLKSEYTKRWVNNKTGKRP